MSDPFLGEIKLVGFPYAPRGWANCDGTTMSVKQSTALFSLLGKTFGGDGTTDFKLPDLRGRVPLHPDTSKSQKQGDAGGSEAVALDSTTMPAHTHTFVGVTSNGDAVTPKGQLYAKAFWTSDSGSSNIHGPYATGKEIPLNPGTCTTSGSGARHENRQPSLVGLFIIALEGSYPMRP